MRTKRNKRQGAKLEKPAVGAKVKKGLSSRASQADSAKTKTVAKEASQDETESTPPRERRPFPIVGIGASAGGLEAFTHLLRHLPADTGMGLVLVQHLDPTHSSVLAELLARATHLPVTEVSDGMKVEPNHVYVIPPNANMSITQGVLKLQARHSTPGHRSVDVFFKSLAQDQQTHAIGVILSGTATDGTLGLEAIKAEGGITFAQDEKSAKYDGMPRNAIASGCVDFVLPPQEIAQELGRLSRHPYIVPRSPALAREPTLDEPTTGEPSDFKKVLAQLRQSKGVDFTAYKPATLHRRIHRRMALSTKLKLRDYVKLLRQNPLELEALFQDLLINVTSFFRDPQTFDALKKDIFPRICKQPSPDEPIRIWVVGCSTGQEAYSIAIALTEFTESLRRICPIQIFATDANEASMERARSAFYPKAQVEDLSAERLRRFFMEVEGGYRLSKVIREMCVFAKHNILADPPFSRMDLISCRNLLIYLQPEMQTKVMPMFHYALKPGGFLWLGNSESAAGFANLFSLVDRRHKIYSKRPAPVRPVFPLAKVDAAERQAASLREKKGASGLRGQMNALREADRILLDRYAPVGVLVNAGMEVLQFRGDTGQFLKHAPGQPSLGLLKMLREALILPVRAIIQQAISENKPVARAGLRFKQHGGMARVNVEVMPLKNLPPGQRHFLVVFEPVGEPGQTFRELLGARGEPLSPVKAPKKRTSRGRVVRVPAESESARSHRLDDELADTKDYLQSVIEQYDAANEELQSASEEAQSTNEELQSINEELETSKEELQASNEELSTVNQELQNRNHEIGALNNDLINLLSSASLPVVMIGPDLRIRRITPPAEKALNVIATDIGRSINDIKLKVEVPDLENIVTEVIERVTPREQEVQDRQGRWHLLRIRPYKTAENKIEGAVIALLDIDPIKRNEQQAKEARDLFAAIVDTVRESMLVLDAELRVKKANRSFCRMFRVRPADIEGKLIYEVNEGQWDIPGVRKFLDQVLPRNAFFNDLEVDRFFDPIGERYLLLNGRKVFREGQREDLILLAIEDVTDRKRHEEALRFSERRYRRLFESAKDGVLIVSPETRKIVDANPFLTELLGYSREEFIGKELWQISLFKDEQTSRAPLEQLLEKGYLRLDDLLLRTKTGESREVELVANLYPEDGHSVIQCNIRDITRRKQAEAALGHSEARFRQLADAIPQLVWTALPSGETDYLNKRWLEYTGVGDETQLRTGWLDATHPEDRDKTLAYWRQAVDCKSDFGVEHRILVRAGYRWFKTRAVPIRNAEGGIIRWFGTSTDIDDVVRARETLAEHQTELEGLVAERTSELETTNKQLEAFVYTIAHDLRAPLRSMEGFSTMLLEQAGPALNERCRDYAVRIRDSAQHMDALLMDLLGFSRVSQQRIELTPVRLEPVVKSALSQVEEQVQAKKARVEAPGPWPSVRAHEATLTQVFVNLLSNALKFVGPDMPPLVRVRAEGQGEFVRVFVEDNGIGIKPEHQEQIFRLFTRLEGDRYPGTGIGLAIVHKSVERMDGRVGLESTPGNGSRFWFDLRAV